MIEVVVVGAGISGLTFAVTLARYRNVKITILERAAVLEDASLFNDPSSSPSPKKKGKKKTAVTMINSNK